MDLRRCWRTLKGVFDIILAKESSRLARNQGLSMRLKELLENNSIHLITMDGAINTLKGETQMFGLYAWYMSKKHKGHQIE